MLRWGEGSKSRRNLQPGIFQDHDEIVVFISCKNFCKKQLFSIGLGRLL